MSKISVLLVDDDLLTINVLSQILWNAGYAIDVARHGMEALEKIKAKKFSVVVMDFMMPYYKGDELAELIRKHDPEIRIILVTGFKLAVHPLAVKDFDIILEKPLEPTVLLETIKQLLAHEPMQKIDQAPTMKSTTHN